MARARLGRRTELEVIEALHRCEEGVAAMVGAAVVRAAKVRAAVVRAGVVRAGVVRAGRGEGGKT